MIIEAYSNPVKYPQALADKNKELDDDDDNDIKKLFNLFEITGDDNDFISNKAFKGVVESNLSMTAKKAKMLIMTKGVKIGRTKKDRGLKGLKHVDNEDDELD